MFENFFMRHDASSASVEILIMLGVTFLLGFVLGRLRGKRRLSQDASRYDRRMQELGGVHHNN